MFARAINAYQLVGEVAIKFSMLHTIQLFTCTPFSWVYHAYGGVRWRRRRRHIRAATNHKPRCGTKRKVRTAVLPVSVCPWSVRLPHFCLHFAITIDSNDWRWISLLFWRCFCCCNFLCVRKCIVLRLIAKCRRTWSVRRGRIGSQLQAI